MKLGKFKNQQDTEIETNDQGDISAVDNEAASQTKTDLPIQVGVDGIASVSLSGKIDAVCFAEIQDVAIDLLERKDVVGLVFDMKNVSYVSSAGLRMFSTVHKKSVSAGKSYKLTQIRGDIMKLFQMTGYASAFCIEVQTEE